MSSSPTAQSTTGAPGAPRPPRTARRRLLTWRRVLLLIVVLPIAAVVAMAFTPTTRWVYCTGYVMTDQEVELRPSVEGAVAEWLVRSGQDVEKDQVVIRLNDSLQRASLEQAQADLKARRAQLQQLLSAQQLETARRDEQIIKAKSNLALAQGNLDRMTVSGDGGGGGFSPKEVENAKLRVEVAQSELNELRISRDTFMHDQIQVINEQIQSAEKNLALRQVELDVRQVHAPMAGTVYFNRYEPGEVVKPEHVLGQVFDRSTWIVKLKVSERQIGHIAIGQPVEVELAAYPRLRFGYMQATVSRILPVVTPRNTGDGIFYIEAKIDDPAQRDLQPGMSASAYVSAGETNWVYRLLGW
jgi:membrane fusion protein (multidrug efflux system)